MDALFGAATTHIRRKVNSLVTGYNSNTTGIASINAGNIGEHVIAVGTDQATAAALSASKIIHRVTAADATVGVKLPAGTIGMCHVVLNTVNAVLNVYPASGEEIENGGANVVLACTALYGYIFTYLDVATGWDTAKFLLTAN